MNGFEGGHEEFGVILCLNGSQWRCCKRGVMWWCEEVLMVIRVWRSGPTEACGRTLVGGQKGDSCAEKRPKTKWNVAMTNKI